MVFSCIVKYCKSIGTHPFPKEELRRAQLIHALQHNIKSYKTIRKSSRICSAHFQPVDFVINKTLTKLDYAPNVLKRTAVPSIFWQSQSALLDTQQRKDDKENAELQFNKPSSSTETGNIDKSKVTITYSRIPPLKFVEIPVSYTDISDETQTENIRREDPLEILSGERVAPQDTDNIEVLLPSFSEIDEIQQEIEIVDTDIKTKSIETQTQIDVLSQTFSVQTQTDVLYGFSIYNYKDDAKSLHYYTGLENFNKTMLVFQTLGQAAYSLNYFYGPPPERIDTLEQFFITIIILRRHKTFEEITMLFKITLKHVYSIFITWIRFMSLQWRNLDLWVNKEHIQAYIPFKFYEQYPATRLLLDATECPIKRPKLPLAQQVTFSSYKNRNTVKFLIGITPGGMINYVSPSYAGSATDRQILERSSILNKFDYNDEIMVDKGFNVQDIFMPYGVKVNMPAFFRKGNQIGSETLSSNRKVASKRVHIERVIGMLKTYKILKEPMNQTETLLSSDIVFVIAMLVNFRTNIIDK